MKKILQISFFLIIMISFPAPYALAQGEDPGQPIDIGIPCVTKEKGFIVHFTAYQQVKKDEDGKQKVAFEKFCHDLPVTGMTFITIDFVDHYTRSQAIALRIAEVAVGKDRGALKEMRTLIDLPEQHYRAGMVETKVNFNRPGLYAVILTLGGENISIPIRVGIEKETSSAWRIFSIIFGILILAALGYAIYRFKDRFPQPTKIQEKKKKEEDQENKD